MHRANAYRSLAQEIEHWRSQPAGELIAQVGQLAVVKHVTLDGEDVAIEVALHWYGEDRRSIRIVGTANGPSHWRFERLEESVVISLVNSA